VSSAEALNLLVKDGGIRGAVIHPAKGEFENVTHDGDCSIAGVGARSKKIASAARNAGLGGFEWMEGIPGNLGGAVRMNAGAMGTETFDQVVSIRFLDTDGSIKEKSIEEIAHRYRNVPEFEERYVLSARLKGKPTDVASIDMGLEASRVKRRTSQPIGASAGCAFKNPELCGAGKLVDELGLKGKRVGAAVVSDVHGNFIVNEGGATARRCARSRRPDSRNRPARAWRDAGDGGQGHWRRCISEAVGARSWLLAQNDSWARRPGSFRARRLQSADRSFCQWSRC